MLSRLRSLLRVFGRAEPRLADGVVVAALVMIWVQLSWIALTYYGLTHPDAAPFIDRDVAATAFWVMTRISPPAWVAFVLAGLVARKRLPQGRFLAHGFAQVFFFQGAAWSYLLGPYTDLFVAMTLFVGTVALLALLGTRVASTGIATFFVILLATPVAARHVQVRTTSTPSWVAWREVEVYAAPEPTSALLLGGGLLGLAVRKRPLH